MYAHFRHPFANRFAVTKIAVFGRSDSMSNASPPNLVFQASEPNVEVFRPKKSDHSECIHSDTFMQSDKREHGERAKAKKVPQDAR